MKHIICLCRVFLDIDIFIDIARHWLIKFKGKNSALFFNMVVSENCSNTCDVSMNSKKKQQI